MAVDVIRRLLWLPVVLFLVSVITFVLGFYAPGDPVQVMLGQHANPETIERLRHEYGFDQPLYVQYINYITNALQGNFGYSLVKYRDQPVGRLIAERLPITIQLNVLALIVGTGIGLPLGVVTGLRRNTRFDFSVRTVTLISISISLLALLPILSFIFSRRQDIFGIQFGPLLPMTGGRFDTIPGTSLIAPTTIPKIILPVLIESLGYIAIMTRQMRASLIDVLGQDYVRTARSKGLRENMVIVRHAMRNALLPIATILGLSLGGLVEGSLLVEPWFGIPGVGALAFDALFAREYYIITAFVLITAVAYVSALLLLDLIRPFLDPRLRQA